MDARLEPGTAGDTRASLPPVSAGIESDSPGRDHELPAGFRCSSAALVLTGLSPTPPAEGNTSTKSLSMLLQARGSRV
ncbi:unnamed protein product [Ectocarpus sp. 8 AP-2014]